MLFDITEDRIKRSKREDEHDCPVATTVREVTGLDVSVLKCADDEWCLELKRGDYTQQVLLPYELWDQIDRYDEFGDEFEPCSFELDLPARMLTS